MKPSWRNSSVACLCLVTFSFPNREFRFTSEVPIRLDYHGKHVSMEQVHDLIGLYDLLMYTYIHVWMYYFIFVLWVILCLLCFREHLQGSLLGWHSWIVQSWNWGACAIDKGMYFSVIYHMGLWFLLFDILDSANIRARFFSFTHQYT